MKKRIISMLVAAMLVCAISAPVLAVEEEENGTTGDAAIAFVKGEEPGIVPPGPATPNIKSANIHFGTRELTAASETYFSTDENVGIDPEEAHAGLVIANSDKDINWEVTVKISKFFKDERETTLEGFELTLHKDQETGIEGDFFSPPEVPSSTAILTGGGGSAIVMKNATGAAAGTFGVNFAGELEVPVNSAELGEATAVMTWVFQAV